MAFFDWNGNGKHDMQDSFMEYQIYRDSQDTPTRTSGSHQEGGISTFGAILSVIFGLVLQVLLYMVLGIDVENVPVLVLLTLWVVLLALTSVACEKIGL